MPDFLAAALLYLRHGWLAHPLGLDPQGYPKRPLTTGWTSLNRTEEVVRSLPWGKAQGLGLILGSVSSNLAVLDVDDVTLAEACFELCTDTRCVRTIRQRGHIYVVEEQPSDSHVVTVGYQGRQVKIELKAQGTQVAAPPTPGYATVVNRPPIRATSLATVWRGVASSLGASDGLLDGYPKPWRDQVPMEERNKSAYIEAHMLREAHMAL
ncbi:hypothetical protein LCGC14_2966920, partial [marine sediment metagenome]